MKAFEKYFEELEAIVEKVRTTQSENIMKAARILADTTEKGGLIYGFGTGHSHLVVDDAFSGVTEVVRGRDILSSTPRQICLYEALGHPIPVYAHIPLMTDAQGRRLAKRDQDIRLASLSRRYSVPWILGMLGYQKPYLAFGKDVLNATADDTWAVNYMNGIYQYVKHNHVLQFDGKKTRAVYALSDSLMQHNEVGQFQQQQQMEQEVKAIIQQYMERMTQDRLMPNRPSHK